MKIRDWFKREKPISAGLYSGTVVVEGRSFDPLPARLQPVRAAPVYARHVRVQLPATHPLLPGERVHVDPRPP